MIERWTRLSVPALQEELRLAVTAGWEQRTIDYARGEVLPSPDLSLVLVDLKDKAMHYNPLEMRGSRMFWTIWR